MNVIPFPKPQKWTNQTKSYRPISLRSPFAKILESLLIRTSKPSDALNEFCVCSIWCSVKYFLYSKSFVHMQMIAQCTFLARSLEIDDVSDKFNVYLAILSTWFVDRNLKLIFEKSSAKGYVNHSTNQDWLYSHSYDTETVSWTRKCSKLAKISNNHPQGNCWNYLGGRKQPVHP